MRAHRLNLRFGAGTVFYELQQITNACLKEKSKAI